MQPRARRHRHIWLVLLSTLLGAGLGCFLYLMPLGRVTGVDRRSDLFFHDTALLVLREHTALVTAPITALSSDNPRLRLVTIDEASLHEAQRDALGQYRVQRDVYARLLERLRQGGAKVVAFDLEFAANAETPSQDRRFAEALANIPTVLSYEISQDEAGPIASRLAAVSTPGFVPVLTENGAVVAQELDDEHGRHAFATAVVEKLLGVPYRRIDDWHGAFGNRIVPLDGSGQLAVAPFETDATTSIERSLGAPSQWIDFARSIELVDALDLPQSELHSFFDGSVVVIGATARGVADFVDTPKGRLPVVFSTLRAVDQLMRGISIERVAMGVDFACIIGMSALVSLAGIRLALRPMVAVCLTAFIGYTTFALAIFATHFIWLDIIHVDVAMLATTLVVGLARSALEGDARRHVTEIFAKHASHDVVHDLLGSELPQSAALFEGRRVYVTIFYSDIRGFTALAEELAPEAIYRQLNEYFEEMCAIVFKYGGYVDKFIGDALMAVFSAPNQHADDAENAVQAAIEQQQQLQLLNATWAAEGRPTLSVGMGLNTGWVIMGQLGSYERVSFTVIGDAVNVAARLKSCAEGGQIVIGESTEQAVRSLFQTEELAPVMVKGKAQPLRTYRVLGELPASEPESEAIQILSFEVREQPSLLAGHEP